MVGHVLRNCVGGALSMTGLQVGLMFSGVLVVEQVFGLHGLGYQIVQAIPQGDQPVVIGLVILAAAFVVGANIIVDLGYALLDPRVRIS